MFEVGKNPNLCLARNIHGYFQASFHLPHSLISGVDFRKTKNAILRYWKKYGPNILLIKECTSFSQTP